VLGDEIMVVLALLCVAVISWLLLRMAATAAQQHGHAWCCNLQLLAGCHSG
jgi:hypothetical protein